MTDNSKIISAIVGVMKDIGTVGKDQKNTFDNYKFRGIDDIYNALQPALIKNEVVVFPKVTKFEQEERKSQKDKLLIYTTLIVEFTFYTTDGSHITCTTVGEAMDRSDKSANKAMSAAYKYAMFQTLAIPTEGKKDTENDSHKPKPRPESDEKIKKEMEQDLMSPQDRTQILNKGKSVETATASNVREAIKWYGKLNKIDPNSGEMATACLDEPGIVKIVEDWIVTQLQPEPPDIPSHPAEKMA